MKTIKSSSPSLRAHFGGLPSAALKAMVSGLLAADKSTTCHVDMHTFGRADYERKVTVCFGCAATWSLQAALGRPMTPGEVESPHGRRQFVDQRWDVDDIVNFKEAMDFARRGLMWPLFKYTRKRASFNDKFDGRFYLTNCDWKNQLQAVRKLIRDLIKLNL